MRTLRILALLGALAVAIVAWLDYDSSRQRRAEEAQDAPAVISEDVTSQSAGWSWSQTAGGRQQVSISAGGYRQDRSGEGIQLTDVRLEIQHPESGIYDRVVTAEAFFDVARDLFYSEGEVTVTLGLPAGGGLEDESAYTRITTSGATFNTRTGEVLTDRAVRYGFAGGRGTSTGARYDSVDRRFTMNRDAYVERFPDSPGDLRTVVRAGQLDYFEGKQHIHLSGGCTLERGPHLVAAETADIFLDQGAIRQVMANQATGKSRGENRDASFEAPLLRVLYSDEGWIERVTGEGPSRLTSMTASSHLSAAGDWIQLRYAWDQGGADSVLTDADITGNGSVEATQAGAGDRRASSERIHLKMKPGGREAAYLETLQRGRISILPAAPGGPSRTLDGDFMRADYASENRIERLQAAGNVKLTDTPPAGERAPLVSWSEWLEADIDPASGELVALRQSAGMRFERGERSGSAEASSYRPAGGQLTLSGDARVDQPGVTITANEIALDEVSGRLDAAGQVAARYRDEGPSAEVDGVFSPGKPVYAAAERMTSRQKEERIVYEGGARLWQELNRVEADRIVIDRADRTLQAEGAVRSTLASRGENDDAAAVRADRLLYTQASRVAAYRGNVEFVRGPLHVAGGELDAQLTGDDGAELESAQARGSVVVRQIVAGRSGFGERVHFDAATDRVVLEGAPARAENRDGEETRGARLTYRVNDESLLVEGKDEPAYTVQRRARD